VKVTFAFEETIFTPTRLARDLLANLAIALTVREARSAAAACAAESTAGGVAVGGVVSGVAAGGVTAGGIAAGGSSVGGGGISAGGDFGLCARGNIEKGVRTNSWRVSQKDNVGKCSCTIKHAILNSCDAGGDGDGSKRAIKLEGFGSDGHNTCWNDIRSITRSSRE
jgi:hypothetical protein